MQPVRIEKLIPGGQALGTMPDGKKIMLWGALPNELATKIEVTKNKSTFVDGIALEISEPSAHRVTPKDHCYLATSPWQILDYNYELEQKRQILQEIFRQHKIILDNIEIQPVATDGKEYFYRNKMEYALYYDKETTKISPAFRNRGTHRKLPIQQSSLERPEIWQAAQAIVQKLNDEHAEARKYQSLLLRCNQTSEVSGGLYEKHQPHPIFSPLHDKILGHDYTYSPNGFFQINLPVYELALTKIKSAIRTEKVLDLYAGVGTIGLSVARDKELTLVECDKSAYQELENNCRDSHAAPILAKSEHALEHIQTEQTVIVDPPRAGCFPSVIEKFLELTPQTIIYLSCNPVTQARDIAKLLTQYQIQLIQPYNFFPRTPHLENLIILERKNGFK